MHASLKRKLRMYYLLGGWALPREKVMMAVVKLLLHKFFVQFAKGSFSSLILLVPIKVLKMCWGLNMRNIAEISVVLRLL
jgi:hypothetical protein